jgi:hypothetical protein
MAADQKVNRRADRRLLSGIYYHFLICYGFTDFPAHKNSPGNFDGLAAGTGKYFPQGL